MCLNGTPSVKTFTIGIFTPSDIPAGMSEGVKMPMVKVLRLGVPFRHMPAVVARAADAPCCGNENKHRGGGESSSVPPPPGPPDIRDSLARVHVKVGIDQDRLI